MQEKLSYVSITNNLVRSAAVGRVLQVLQSVLHKVAHAVRFTAAPLVVPVQRWQLLQVGE